MEHNVLLKRRAAKMVTAEAVTAEAVTAEAVIAEAAAEAATTNTHREKANSNSPRSEVPESFESLRRSAQDANKESEEVASEIMKFMDSLE